MNDLKRPLIPQFSLRWILAMTAVLAVVSFVVAHGLRGAPWAVGVAFGLAAIVAAFGMYAVLFAISIVPARMAAAKQLRSKTRSDSPVDPSTPTSTVIAKTVLLVLAFAASQSSEAYAASGGSVTFPILGPKQTNKTGLTLTVNTSWVDACGYRPVTFEFKSLTGPVAADRVLRVHFAAGGWQLDGSSTAVTQTIEMPAGSAVAKGILSVPQRQPWMSYEWDVFEDGQHVGQLSSGGSLGFFAGGRNHFGDGAPPTVLALSGQSQISVNHLTVFGQTEETVLFVGPTPSGAPASAMLRGRRTATTVTMTGALLPSLADLPTRWIDYSSIDIVLTSVDELKTLVNKHPAQWKAIKAWLRSGGSLVVYGTGEKWENLADLELLASAKDEPTWLGERNSDGENSEDRWRMPRGEMRDSPLSGVNTVSTTNTVPVDQTSPSTAALTRDNSPFLTRTYGDGVIAAIRSDDKFSGDDFSWVWLYNTIGPERWQWFQRYGVSLTRDNSEFWNFLIPGVGAAPVIAFQVLITLFVLLIGPLNYYLLRRIGKLNLMVISVPLCALGMTAGLLIYSLVADGLQVRLRARSLTRIDQRTGQSDCWARLSYYAGLPPRGGLLFSDETIALPLEHEQQDVRGGSPRTLDWERINRSDPNSRLNQRLADGWLKSRTPTQFVTVRLEETKASLRISPPTGGPSLQVKNELGVDLIQLLVIDDQQKCFTASGLDAGQSATLAVSESQADAAQKLIEPLMVKHDPQSQPSLMMSPTDDIWGIGRYRNYSWYNSGNSSTEAQQSTSVTERAIFELRQKLLQNQLPPQTYVAIVKTSPMMEIGTPSAQEESSFHIVIGRW